MDVTRKRARAWLRMCSRIELDRAMEEARLTEQQREVIELNRVNVYPRLVRGCHQITL